MNGLIDIHTHIIPGVDDGAQTEDVSRAMLDRYGQNGFETIIATPHMPLIPEGEYVQRIAHGNRDVTRVADEQGLKVLSGVEVRLSPDIWTDSTAVRSFGLAGTRYVLVDFPSGAWPHYAEDSLFAVQTLGLTPILAHPERYGWGSSNRNTAKELVNRGVLLQVTLGSLVGAFGSNAKTVSHELLKSGLVHFTATDAHSAGSRMKAGVEGIRWLRKQLGDEAVQMTLSDNPALILNDDGVNPFVPGSRRRFWTGPALRNLISRH